MNSLLLTIGSLLILAFSLLFAAPFFVNWNDYRNVFEAQASNLVGRSVKVRGNVNMRFLPTPYVRFQDVKIAGKDDGDNASFLEADDFTIWLSLPPLLRGSVEAREVEIFRPRLNLRIGEDGGGNWKGIGNLNVELPYMPKEVALDAVQIRDGEIYVHQAEREPIYAVKGLNGTLSASSLRGPYKFNGAYKLGRQNQTIKFSTSRHEVDRPMVIRGKIYSETNGASYRLNGSIVGLDDSPRITGTVGASLPIPGDSVSVTGKTELKRDGRNLVELSASIDGRLDQIQLKNIRASFESQNKPQIVEGEMTARWKDGLDVSAKLGSRWLDFDQTLANRQLSQPLPAVVIKQYLISILRRAEGIETGSLDLKIGQASIGGELVTNFEASFLKQNNDLNIAMLRAELPGQNEIRLNGKVGVKGESLRFSGPIAVRGRNLGFLTQWALSRKGNQKLTNNSFYTLKGELDIAKTHIEIRNGQGELSGSALSGSLKYNFGNSPEISLRMDSDRVDLRGLIGNSVTLTSLLKVLAPLKQDQAATNSASKNRALPEDVSGDAGADNSQDRVANVDTKQNPENLFSDIGSVRGLIDLRIGHIIMPDLNGRDLVTKIKLANGALNITEFNVRTDSGAHIRANGKIDRLSQTPKGTMQILLEADTGKAVGHLIKFFEFPDVFSDDELRLDAVSPMRFAVSLQLGLEEVIGVRLRVDGAAGDSHLVLTAGQEGSLGELGSRALNISGIVTNPDGRSLVRQLVGEDLSKFGVDQGEGSFRLDVSGTPRNFLNADVTLETSGLSTYFKGKITTTKPDLEIDGIVDLKSKSAGLGLSFLGLSPSFDISNSEIDLKLKLRKKGTSYQLTNIKGNWGGSEFSADVVFDPSQRPKLLDIRANATNASIPGIFGLTLQHRPRTILDLAKEAVDESRTSWPNQPFDRAFFSNFQGALKLRASELRISNHISLKNGDLEATLKNEQIKLIRLNGRMFEGKFSGEGELQNTSTGVELKGAVSLEDAQLDRLLVRGQDDRPMAKGKFGIDANFSGHGLSPKGLVSVFSGQGTLKLGDGEIPDFSPLALPEAIVQSAISSKTGNEGNSRIIELSEDLKKKLKGRSFPFTSMTLPLNIGNGSVRLDKVELASAGTSVDIRANLELLDFALNSEWTLESQQPGLKTQLPPARISFRGFLPEAGDISPGVNTKALDQFLTVRRMERSVAELERLQRLEKELLEKEKSRRSKEHRLRQQRINAEEEARRKAALLEEQLQKQENLTLGSPSQTNFGSNQGFVTNSIQIQKPDKANSKPLRAEEVPLPPKPENTIPDPKPVWSPFKEFFEDTDIFSAN